MNDSKTVQPNESTGLLLNCFLPTLKVQRRDWGAAERAAAWSAPDAAGADAGLREGDAATQAWLRAETQALNPFEVRQVWTGSCRPLKRRAGRANLDLTAWVVGENDAW